MNENPTTTIAHASLSERSISGESLSWDECRDILDSNKIGILPLLKQAFEVRKKYWGMDVLVHILDNVQNGNCSQDCQYCAQSCNSEASITTYSIKSDEEILSEARAAHEAGAFRHCMVLSGLSQTQDQIEHFAHLIREIKKLYPMELCLSPGLLNPAQVKTLKNAGLDRVNHNINTSRNYYVKICSTHTFEDRLDTIKAVKEAGMGICSGVIIGMGESQDDVIEMAMTLRDLQADSIPVNFFMPIEGLPLKLQQKLNPEYCLRVLCLFRFMNPQADIRMAAGREIHLRQMQVLGLFAATSLFMRGYLNTEGASDEETLQMIRDAGFTVRTG